MNERIKELEKQLQDAWLAYCKVNGMGHPLHSMNRDTYATFKDGWNAALAAMVAPKSDGDE
jgi:hypothetical protein